MKFLLLFFLLAVFAGCGHFANMKRRTEAWEAPAKASAQNGVAERRAALEDYYGSWKLEKEVYGCFPVKIEKGPAKGTIKITREPSAAVFRLDSPPQTRIISDYYKYNLSTSSLYRFIRGQIVSASIWAPDTNDWLGTGLRAWILDDAGVLIKKKAGLTMKDRDKSNNPKEKEKAVSVFDLKGNDVIVRWEVECRYIKKSSEAQVSGPPSRL